MGIMEGAPERHGKVSGKRGNVKDIGEILWKYQRMALKTLEKRCNMKETAETSREIRKHEVNMKNNPRKTWHKCEISQGARCIKLGHIEKSRNLKENAAK